MTKVSAILKGGNAMYLRSEKIMKTIIALLFIGFSACCYGQTDSTTIKLNQYKAWKDAGVIDEDEYNRLKGAVLNLPIVEKKQAPISKVDSATIESYFSKSKGNTTGGIIMMSLGVVFVAGTATYAVLTPAQRVYTSSNGKTELIKNESRPIAIGCGIAVGIVSIVTGAVLLGTGAKNRELYKNAKANLAFVDSTDRIGLCLNF